MKALKNLLYDARKEITAGLVVAFLAWLAAKVSGFGLWERYVSMKWPARILGPLAVTEAIAVGVLLVKLKATRKSLWDAEEHQIQIVTPASATPSEVENGAVTIDVGPKEPFGYPSPDRIKNDPFTSVGPSARTQARMSKERDRDEYYIGQKGMKIDERTYLPAGPAGTPSVPWIPSDDLELERRADPTYGISISFRNVGTRRLNKVEIKLYSLRTFHKGKRTWREQRREDFTFGRPVDLQPDEHTEGHWLAFLNHTGKIELTLPKDSYMPNPETRAQIFEAKIQIMCDKGGRMETVCFSWEPGKAPHVLTDEEIYDLEHGT